MNQKVIALRKSPIDKLTKIEWLFVKYIFHQYLLMTLSITEHIDLDKAINNVESDIANIMNDLSYIQHKAPFSKQYEYSFHDNISLEVKREYFRQAIINTLGIMLEILMYLLNSIKRIRESNLDTRSIDTRSIDTRSIDIAKRIPEALKPLNEEPNYTVRISIARNLNPLETKRLISHEIGHAVLDSIPKNMVNAFHQKITTISSLLIILLKFSIIMRWPLWYIFNTSSQNSRFHYALPISTGDLSDEIVSKIAQSELLFYEKEHKALYLGYPYLRHQSYQLFIHSNQVHLYDKDEYVGSISTDDVFLSELIPDSVSRDKINHHLNEVLRAIAIIREIQKRSSSAMKLLLNKSLIRLHGYTMNTGIKQTINKATKVSDERTSVTSNEFRNKYGMITHEMFAEYYSFYLNGDVKKWGIIPYRMFIPKSILPIIEEAHKYVTEAYMKTQIHVPTTKELDAHDTNNLD